MSTRGMRNKYDIVSQVVSDCQYAKIRVKVGGGKVRSVILDLTTASALKHLFDRAPIEKREKLIALPWDRLLGMIWVMTS